MSWGEQGREDWLLCAWELCTGAKGKGERNKECRSVYSNKEKGKGT